MKILVLGATGRTGKCIIAEASRRGHQVSAIARDPQKLADFPVEITIGTPYDYETVEKAIKGCEAVINTINVSRKTENFWAPLRAPQDLISTSAAHAIQAMEKTGVKRFIALSTLGAGTSWKTIPWFMKVLVSISNLKYAFQDHGRQEKLLINSAMDYTICRAPMLSDKIHPEGAVATPEHTAPASMYLNRSAAAEFFINIIKNGAHIRETISLANKPVKK